MKSDKSGVFVQGCSEARSSALSLLATFTQQGSVEQRATSCAACAQNPSLVESLCELIANGPIEEGADDFELAAMLLCEACSYGGLSSTELLCEQAVVELTKAALQVVLAV